MHLRQLALTNFRNYARQDLDLEPGPVLLLGQNAQGKTNLLEAVFLLATGRSERAETDADFIAWGTRDEMQPYARVVGAAHRGTGDLTVEVAVLGRAGAKGLVASKRFKLNGVPKRASDVIGGITAVLFTTDDMELVKGAPSGRRRYLDIMLSQVDRAYLRALQRYTKVITQRNALLKRIQDGAAQSSELAYWDDELSRDGAVILATRAAAVAQLSTTAASMHARLSGEREQFALAYQPRFIDTWSPARIIDAGADAVAAALLDKLHTTHPRDVAAGVTLSGPHRDDLSMTLGGESAASFASRPAAHGRARAASRRGGALARAWRRAPDPAPRRRALGARRIASRQRPRRHRCGSSLDHQPRPRPLRRGVRAHGAGLAHRERPRRTRGITADLDRRHLS